MSIIIVADDHPLYRDAVNDVIDRYVDHELRLQAADLNQVYQQLSQYPDADLVLLDLNMPGMNGLQGLIELRRQFPATAVAMLSAHDDKHTVLEAIKLGALGYISKSLAHDALAAAINQLLRGEMYLPALSFQSTTEETIIEPESKVREQLTERQFQVLLLLGQGASNKDIATQLHIAETTVKTHVSAILDKLELDNRMQAGLLANRLPGQMLN
ncbi:MAG: DNA-binding response regulator [Idiomarina sp.]|nr:DNA-binding response regulator [Idiomarina sp.]MCL5051452.1 response regulator transcription factor [Bacillota bacterium]